MDLLLEVKRLCADPAFSHSEPQKKLRAEDSSMRDTGTHDVGKEGQHTDDQPKEDSSTNDTGIPRASFMGLPVELRLHIYGYIPEPTKTPTPPLLKVFTGTRWIERLGILLANKQVFAEAMPIIYSAIEVGQCLSAIPVYAREHVQSVRLNFDCGGPGWDGVSLRQRHGLDSLRMFLAEAYPRLAQFQLSVCDVDYISLPDALDCLCKLPNLQKVLVDSQIPGMYMGKALLAEKMRAAVAQAGEETAVAMEVLETGRLCLRCS